MACNKVTWVDRVAGNTRKFSIAWDDESWDADLAPEDLEELRNKSQKGPADKPPDNVAAAPDSEQGTEKESSSEFDRSTVSTGISTPSLSVKDGDHTTNSRGQCDVKDHKAIVDDWANYCRDDELWRLQSALGNVDWEGEKWETVQSKNTIRAAKEQEQRGNTAMEAAPSAAQERSPRRPQRNRRNNSNNTNTNNLTNNNNDTNINPQNNSGYGNQKSKDRNTNRSNNPCNNKNNNENNRKNYRIDQRGKPTEKQPEPPVQVAKTPDIKPEQKAEDLEDIKKEKIQELKPKDPRFHNFFGLLKDNVKKSRNRNRFPKTNGTIDKVDGAEITNEALSPTPPENKSRKRNRKQHKNIAPVSNDPEEVEGISEKEEEIPLATKKQKIEATDLEDNESPRNDPRDGNSAPSDFKNENIPRCFKIFPGVTYTPKQFWFMIFCCTLSVIISFYGHLFYKRNRGLILQ